jgi:hypothetical protein
MSLTPDSSRILKVCNCAKCGRHLTVNDQAIIFDGLFNNHSLLIGSCCADNFFGSFLQDYSKALKEEAFVGQWIKHQSVGRLIRIADSAELISKKYRLAAKSSVQVELSNMECGS